MVLAFSRDVTAHVIGFGPTDTGYLRGQSIIWSASPSTTDTEGRLRERL